MNDVELARLAAEAYMPVPLGTVVDWQDVRAVVTGDVVALRGTQDPADILRDAEAWPERSAAHPQLGMCHAGMLAGATGILPLLSPYIAGRRVIVTGHSLGGGVAILVAALLVLAGTPPGLVVTFEAPKVGGASLRGVLGGALSIVPGRQYRHGNDPVTEVPWAPGIFEHVWAPLIAIGAAQPDPIECHFIRGVWRELAQRWVLTGADQG